MRCRRTGRRVDRHTGDLAAERVDEVDILVSDDGISIHLLYVVRQRLLGTFNAQGRNNDLLDLDGRIGQCDVESRARADGHDTGFVADETDRQFGVVDRGGERQGKVSVDTGGRSDGRPLDQNGGSDNAQTAGSFTTPEMTDGLAAETRFDSTMLGTVIS